MSVLARGFGVADIFVSYTSSDREWADWIGHELINLGHAPHLHDWEISAGDNIMAWMIERHDKADFILGVVSDAWLKAAYSIEEHTAGAWAAARARPGFMRYVVVRPTTLPTIVDHRKRVEIFGVPDEVKRRRLKDYLAEAARSPPPDHSPEVVFALSNIPIRVPTHFLGRDDSLKAIDAALKRYEGRVAITALHGLRGVGKTTLAAAYADQHRGDYRATWWIRAQTPDTTRADLVSLGARLKWVAPDEKGEPALGAVMERLRHEGDGLLLIFDNAIDAASIEGFLPPGGAARVLITSNAHDWGGLAEPIDIRLWPKNIGAEFLILRTRREAERADAEALSDALGGLPLAHEQAAAYCERLGVSFVDYLQRFEKEPIKFLADARHAPRAHNDGQTVERSFALAIEQVSKLHQKAEPLIFHAALLAPEPLPLFLLEELWGCIEPQPQPSTYDGEGAPDVREDLEEAIAALRAFALVDRETVLDEREPSITTDTIRLHRLVREVAKRRREGEALEAARRALLEAMAAVYPGEEVFNEPKTWPRARRLDALALALVAGDAAPPQGAEGVVSNLLNLLAGYRCGSLAAYAQARPLYERALAIREKGLGPEHPYMAGSLNNFALLLCEQGDFSAARPLYERALAIREKALGPEHPETALILNNLARLLEDQGDLVAALPLYERALAIKEKALGPAHPDTALSLNNLAESLRKMGDLARARPLHERALAIREKALGPEHSWTATSLNNLSLLLEAQRDFAGARPQYERALRIKEKTLGAEHPSTNLGRGNLARLLLASGGASEALPLAEAALAAHEKILGPDHPWTSASARITAEALEALGRGGEAAGLRARFGL